MDQKEANNILRAITENAPLGGILSDICRLSCAPAEGAGNKNAACILLADTASRTPKPAAAAGMPVDSEAASGALRREYLALERLCQEVGHPPLVIDNLPAHPLAGALFSGEAVTPYKVAWVWPLNRSNGGYLGLMIRFLSEASAPNEDQREALQLCARLATTAVSLCRENAGEARPADLLEILVENVNQGIALFGKDLTLLQYNKTYESLYNFAEGFLKKGVHYLDVMRHLIDRGEFGDIDAEAYLSERMRSMEEGNEWRNLRHKPDGSVIAVYRKNLIGGGAIVTLTDVTEDLRLSLENQRNAKLLESTVSNVKHGVRVIDADGRLVLWNRRYQDICGYPDYLMQKGMAYECFLRFMAENENMTDAEAEEFMTSRLKMFRDSEYSGTQRRMSDGTTVRVDRAPMPDGGFVTTYTDITKLVETETELARKTDLLGTTLDNINQGLLVLDQNLNVVLFNDSYLRLLGVKESQIKVGMRYSDVLRILCANGEFGADSGTTEEIIAARVRRARTGGTQHDVHRRPNGTNVSVYRTPMPGGGRVMTYTDITDLKQAEARLVNARDIAEQANRAKTEFLANMSHELRTPLNAIIGFSEIMQAGVFGQLQDPRYRDYVDSINQSGTHLLSLINDILDLSKIEIGKAILDEEVLDLAETIESCLILVREGAEKSQIALISEIPGDFPDFTGDRRRLKQIVINLLQNAMKFTPAHGSVTVTLEYIPGSPVTITIADTGIGMAASDIPRALERFSQVESGLKRRYEGAGLGLPLAQGMAQMHGGEIEIESTLGEGTTVRVTLPESRISGAPGGLSLARA